MKQLTLLSTVLTIFLILNTSNSSFAQHANRNVVKFNVASAPFGLLQPGYEYAINDKMSAGGYITVLSRTIGASGFGAGSGTTFKYSGFGFVPEFKYYVSHEKKPAPAGFYVGPYIYYLGAKMTVTSDGDEGSVKGTIFGGGASLGYQWLIADVFAIDLFGGFGYLSGSLGDVKITDSNGSTTTYAGSISFGGTVPRFGVSVGIAF